MNDNDDMLLLRVPAPVRVMQVKEDLRDIEEGTGDITLLLWPLALLFFGLGDTISSFLVFSKGGTEVNPIMRGAMLLPGGLLAFVYVKAAAILLLYYLSHRWEGVHQWAIPFMMMVAGVYLTFSNVTIYLEHT